MKKGNGLRQKRDNAIGRSVVVIVAVAIVASIIIAIALVNPS